jgi:hypothetical protein
VTWSNAPGGSPELRYRIRPCNSPDLCSYITPPPRHRGEALVSRPGDSPQLSRPRAQGRPPYLDSYTVHFPSATADTRGLTL